MRFVITAKWADGSTSIKEHDLDSAAKTLKALSIDVMALQETISITRIA